MGYDAEERLGLTPNWNRDTAVGLAGAAVLIAAMAGVFFYERAQFDEHDVTWEQMEVDSENEGGSLDEETSNSYTFSADADRLSRVVLTLRWTDDAGAADTFEIVAQGPNGTYTGTQEGSSSPLEIEIPIRGAPDTTTVAARSIKDARDQLNDTETWTNGTGEWSVTVTLVSAPGEQAPVGGQETDQDGSQDYELAFSYARWEPSLAPS